MDSTPVISVIMPVYNPGKYLAQSIESILAQTFGRFKFIIVNDCSTDSSHAVISSYTDQRIVYKQHPQNRGVVAAMNTGLQEADTPYVCIMHADDIALPERLEKQKEWLDRHPETALIAGKTIHINEQGEPAGEWELDNRVTGRREIKRVMKWENCITHSTVMMRTDILKKYGYDDSQQLSAYAVEDYPLWLNLLSDSYILDKLNFPVIQYRVHTQNTTHVHYKKINPYYLNYQTKKIYLATRKSKGGVTAYDKAICYTMYLDRIKAFLKEGKSFINRVFR